MVHSVNDRVVRFTAGAESIDVTIGEQPTPATERVRIRRPRRRHRQRPRGDLFIAARAVDEYQLRSFPAAAGAGRRLVPTGARLELVGAERIGPGELTICPREPCDAPGRTPGPEGATRPATAR
ncbi:hypothetical protein GCM10022240_29510 [Microbacterium kribbense]|uniref:MOSC domain-containing protein n=1 Tax=Microbacterium kribbense TaxID=433645 RepID=A0ABP7GWQ7_9MICO